MAIELSSTLHRCRACMRSTFIKLFEVYARRGLASLYAQHEFKLLACVYACIGKCQKWVFFGQCVAVLYMHDRKMHVATFRNDSMRVPTRVLHGTWGTCNCMWSVAKLCGLLLVKHDHPHRWWLRMLGCRCHFAKMHVAHSSCL